MKILIGPHDYFMQCPHGTIDEPLGGSWSVGETEWHDEDDEPLLYPKEGQRSAQDIPSEKWHIQFN